MIQCYCRILLLRGKRRGLSRFGNRLHDPNVFVVSRSFPIGATPIVSSFVYHSCDIMYFRISLNTPSKRRRLLWALSIAFECLQEPGTRTIFHNHKLSGVLRTYSLEQMRLLYSTLGSRASQLEDRQNSQIVFGGNCGNQFPPILARYVLFFIDS